MTVTTIGDIGQDDRLQHLIDALRAAGRGLPARFEVHGPWTSPDLYNVLRSFDQTLNANGTTQPIVVGEASYNDPNTAADIARFINDTGRPVAEVYEWWQTTTGGSCASRPALQISTGKRFVGQRVWRVEIGTAAPYGSLYAYGSDRDTKNSFVIH